MLFLLSLLLLSALNDLTGPSAGPLAQISYSIVHSTACDYFNVFFLCRYTLVAFSFWSTFSLFSNGVVMLMCRGVPTFPGY